MISVNISEISNWLGCKGSVVSTGGNSEEIVKACGGNDKHQILPDGGIMAPISFLCSRIPNENSLYRYRR